jgi:hypothetical protein
MLALLLCASACGRLRFDPTSGDGQGMRFDAPVMGFNTRPGIDANIVFVSEANVAVGTLGGLLAADDICRTNATAWSARNLRRMDNALTIRR